MKFRKLPVVVDAFQLKHDWAHDDAFFDWCEEVQFDTFLGRGNLMIIPTLEGQMTAHIGDWVLRGAHGEFYPVKDHIFRSTYESA